MRCVELLSSVSHPLVHDDCGYKSFQSIISYWILILTTVELEPL